VTYPIMRLSYSFCAGPAAAGAWHVPEESRPVSPPSVMPALPKPPKAAPAADPLRDCLRQAQAAMGAGELDVALGWFRHASAINETLVLPRIGAALCLIQSGREAEGSDEIAHAYEVSGKPGEVDATLARLYLLGGERDAAFQSAHLAVEHDTAWAQSLREDPVFRPMRDHPMFLQALNEL
jgi:hypothetical protein